ncbi:MAG: DNA repair protein RadC [Lachnospiraceae bacterium]|nr:DNA repair protein RadC [Lachnospiraceae bacterium]
MKKEKRISQNHDILQNETKHMKILDLPEDERPYEKCVKFGPSVLSDAELLAAVIRSGTPDTRVTDLACRILKLREGYSGLNCLFHLGMKELMGIKGIGRVKAIQLMCVAEMARRMSIDADYNRMDFNDPEVVMSYFGDRLRHLEHEEVHVAYLDLKMRLISSECVYKGTLNRSLFEPREIFSGALKANAAAVIIAHNHPSGSPVPSETDISSTGRVYECGNFLGIKLLDHIIVGYEGCISMREEGILAGKR